MAGSLSQPNSSWARCSAGRSAAFRRSGGYFATALAKPSSKRFCCAGEKGDATGPALVPREIIAARTCMARPKECQGSRESGRVLFLQALRAEGVGERGGRPDRHVRVHRDPLLALADLLAEHADGQEPLHLAHL